MLSLVKNSYLGITSFVWLLFKFMYAFDEYFYFNFNPSLLRFSYAGLHKLDPAFVPLQPANAFLGGESSFIFRSVPANFI